MNSIGTGNNFPPQHPTWWDKMVSYLLVVGFIVPTIEIFMNLLNRTRIIGRKNIKKLPLPWILMSNHLTLLDDLFLDPLLITPHVLGGYRYIPFHAPEESNFYKKRLIAWFMRRTKSIPLIRGRGPHQEGMDRLIQAVKDGSLLHIYPEGTRSRTGRIGNGKSGVGRIVYESGAPVVPMYHQGMENILPIGSGFPRIGKEIRMAIGEPIYFEEELKMENNLKTWKLITQRIMEAIQQQREILEEQWGSRDFRPSKNNVHQNEAI